MESHVFDVILQMCHYQSLGGGSEKHVTGGDDDVAHLLTCILRIAWQVAGDHGGVVARVLHTGDAATQGGYPQPAMAVFGNAVDIAVGQAADRLYGETAARRLSQPYQSAGLAAQPEVAVVGLGDTVDSFAKGAVGF